jgi:hypothetical protein
MWSKIRRHLRKYRHFDNHWDEFVFFMRALAIYALFSLIPAIYHLFTDYQVPSFVKFIYHTVKEILGNVVGGIAFYIAFETRMERSRLKYELKYVIHTYEQMKKDILERMIIFELTESTTQETVDKIYNNPTAAREYFSQDRFLRIYNNMDDSDIKFITRKMRFFLSQLDPLSYKFLEKGNDSLKNIFHDIQDMEARLDEGAAYDWITPSKESSNHPLYQLFCRKVVGGSEDPYCQMLMQIKDRYR